VNPKTGGLKKLCYVCLNIGVVIWCCVFVLEGMSLSKGIFSLAFSVALANVLIWYVFKKSEESGQ
jgi:hypothetical protein